MRYAHRGQDLGEIQAREFMCGRIGVRRLPPAEPPGNVVSAAWIPKFYTTANAPYWHSWKYNAVKGPIVTGETLAPTATNRGTDVLRSFTSGYRGTRRSLDPV
jgi:hypothetical protein